jgi:hypothetical protein
MAMPLISSLSSSNYYRPNVIGQTDVSQTQTSKAETEIDDNEIWEMTFNEFKNLECPFPGENNPNIDIAEKANQEWAQKIGIPSCGKFLPATLMAGAYPHCSAEMLSIFTRLLAVIFIYDDKVEKVLHKDLLQLKELNRKFLRTLESGMGEERRMEDHDEDDLLVKAASDLNKQFRGISSPKWWDRFIQDVKEYCEANYWESTKKGIPEIQTYLEKRALTGAVYLFLDLCELAEGTQIKDEVFNSEYFKDVRLRCNNLIWMSNDIISFAKEAKGTGNNMIHIFMAKEQCSLPEAIGKTKSYYSAELAKLQSLLQNMPSEYGDHEKKCINGFLFWVKSVREWSLVTPRYQKPESPNLSWQKV